MGCSLHRIFAKCNTPLAFGLALLILALAPAMAAGSAWAEEPPLWNAAWITDTQTPECEWIRGVIVQPDKSSVSIVLQHKHEVADLAKCFERLEGQHNVKLVLSGDHHNYKYKERHGVTFITAAGLAKGPTGENDAMTLWVYENHLRLERYVIPRGRL